MSARTETISRICGLWRDGHTATEIAQITGDRVGIVRTVIERERNAGRLTRSESVTVLVPPHLRKRVSHRARRAGVGIDKYVRTVLLEALGHD